MTTVILFRGRPGVGKTSVSNRLSERLRYPIIRKDDIYDVLAGTVDGHDNRNRLCYGILYQMLDTNASNGSSVILDFPFNRKEDMSALRQWLDSKRIVFKSVLCVCSDETIWAKRFEERKENPLPNQLITDFEQLKRHYGGDLTIVPVDGELVVDTIEPLERIVEKVMEYISAVPDS
ncbi:MAG: hypothetical protein K0Q94_1728 [Paenibacillus sp.]|jgi:predicted kinase|nr:hypothetical protein [Paenibacillus sp.]